MAVLVVAALAASTLSLAASSTGGGSPVTYVIDHSFDGSTFTKRCAARSQAQPPLRVLAKSTQEHSPCSQPLPLSVPARLTSESSLPALLHFCVTRDATRYLRIVLAECDCCELLTAGGVVVYARRAQCCAARIF